MGKLCIIDVIAPLYRKGIFQLIESNYDCIWLFGESREGIKELDFNTLSVVEKAPYKKVFGPIYYQSKCIKKIFQKEVSTFLINGEPYCLSSWAIALLALFFKNKNVYFWSHGWYGKENFIKKIIKKIYFKLPTASFIYGNYAKDLMIKEGINPQKLIVIHNSLDYKNQTKIRSEIQRSDIYYKHFNNSNHNLIFIGRLTAVKKLDYILKALSLLKKKGIFFNVTFVGDGEEKNNLLELTKELELCSQVWFYGACYDEVKNSELIYNSDLCIAPGNVGLTAIHCMTFGTPVITHNDFRFQMPEFEAIKANKTGNFFQPNDIKSLAECIENWFNSHSDRIEVRKACYNEIDSYWNPNYQIDIFKKNLLIR